MSSSISPVTYFRPLSVHLVDKGNNNLTFQKASELLVKFVRYPAPNMGAAVINEYHLFVPQQQSAPVISHLRLRCSALQLK
jgi:hypothetical protein